MVFGGIALTQIRISRAEVGAGVAIWMLGYGVLLLAIARGVFRGRRWSRAPAIATQLILLPIAFSFRGSRPPGSPVRSRWLVGHAGRLAAPPSTESSCQRHCRPRPDSADPAGSG